LSLRSPPNSPSGLTPPPLLATNNVLNLQSHTFFARARTLSVSIGERPGRVILRGIPACYGWKNTASPLRSPAYPPMHTRSTPSATTLRVNAWCWTYTLWIGSTVERGQTLVRADFAGARRTCTLCRLPYGFLSAVAPLHAPAPLFNAAQRHGRRRYSRACYPDTGLQALGAEHHCVTVEFFAFLHHPTVQRYPQLPRPRAPAADESRLASTAVARSAFCGNNTALLHIVYVAWFRWFSVPRCCARRALILVVVLAVCIRI